MRSSIYSSLFLLILVIVSIVYASPSPYSISYKPPGGFTRSLTLYAPAVTRSGEGALIKVNLTLIYPGSGRVYFSAQPLVELDTQATARIAAYVASRVAGYDFYRYNYIVDMTSGSIVVGGPSAGGLMTIGFISLFLNKTPNQWVTMTGMINPDGSIGPVGGLLGKLQAVADKGFKVFLIPYGEEETMIARREIHRFLWGYYETISYEIVNLVEKGRELGVDVIDVASIVDAMRYFLNITYQPQTVNPVLPTTVNDLLEKYLMKDRDYALKIYDRVDTMYGKLNILKQIRLYHTVKEAEDAINRLNDLIGKGLFKAAFIEIPNVLSPVLRAYWTIKYERKELRIDDLIVEANKTINETYKLFAGGNIGLNPVSIEAYRNYYLALNSYIGLMKKIKNANPENVINRVSSIIGRLNYTQQLINISEKIGASGYSITEKDLHLLYSIADSTISYAYSLAKDVGSTNEYINKAVDMFNKAIDALNINDTYAAIPLLIDTITYADIGIEKLFITNTSVLSSIARYLRETALTYVSPSDYGDVFYILAGDDYRSYGPIDEALKYYMKASLYSSILSKYNASNKTYTIKPPQLSIPSGPNKTPQPVITLPGDPMKSFILGILTGIIISFIIYMFSRIFVQRKDSETGLVY